MTVLPAEERIRLQRECVDEHIRSENEGRWEAVYETFVDSSGASVDFVPLCMAAEGREGVRGFYEVIQSAFPDLYFDVTGEYDGPGYSIRECTATGTQLGEYCGLPPTGRRGTVELIAVFVFDPDEPRRVVTERVYFDNETLIRQLRGDENAPTGIGLASRVRTTTAPPAG